MAKRLRGWQLDKEKAPYMDKRPLEQGPLGKGGTSGLASKLLTLWSVGTLAACQVQQLAHLAVLDGAQVDELIILAKAGNWGESPGNCHRDLLRQFGPAKQHLASWPVTIECKDPKTALDKEEKASIFLPHVMLPSLVDISQVLLFPPFVFLSPFFCLCFQKLMPYSLGGTGCAGFGLWPRSTHSSLQPCSRLRSWKLSGPRLLQKGTTGYETIP